MFLTNTDKYRDIHFQPNRMSSMKRTATPTTSDPRSDPLNTLQALVQAHSKHSDYQLLHPSLKILLGDIPQPAGRHEAQRQYYMARRLPLNGLRVLDIGANTGYFTFAALADGAREVVSQEGNTEHARFVTLVAEGMDLGHRLEIRPGYYRFEDPSNDCFDVTFCLNVLHHLGDDFGDRHISLEPAKTAMLAALNGLSLHTRHLWMQLGFNWKGDRSCPLFSEGTKVDVIDFVRQGTQEYWCINDIAVVNPKTLNYEPIAHHNLGRFDALGEFLNRPLFLMTSLRFGGDFPKP